MKQRILSLVLALILCLGFAVPALAAGDFVIEDGVLTKYNGPGGNVIIPSGVTTIGDGAFWCCEDLISVVIPEGVTEIDDNAFFYCKYLTKVDIPSTIKSIGNSAFDNCRNLSNIAIPYGTTTIGESAFSYCESLTDISIPNSVTTIDKSAFYGCNGLTDVVIPDSITKIDDFTFCECYGLKRVTLGNNVAIIGRNAFCYCSNLESIVVPPSVMAIGTDAFDGTQAVSYGVAGTAAERAGSFFLPGIPGELAYASTQMVNVDGVSVEFQMYALKDLNGNMTNYVKLRDVAHVLNGTPAQFAVNYAGTISVAKGQPYVDNGSEMKTPYSGDRTYDAYAGGLRVNGSSWSCVALSLVDDQGGGYTYYQLRDLGKALGFNVGWVADKGVFIETSKAYDDNN